MSRTWLSIRVELVEGHGEHLWPRPGRIFAAARTGQPDPPPWRNPMTLGGH